MNVRWRVAEGPWQSRQCTRATIHVFARDLGEEEIKTILAEIGRVLPSIPKELRPFEKELLRQGKLVKNGDLGWDDVFRNMKDHEEAKNKEQLRKRYERLVGKQASKRSHKSL